MIDALIAWIKETLYLFQFWGVLADYEIGVRLRFGRFVGELGPGLFWKIPFGVDVILFDNYVPQTVNLPSQSLTTQDAKGVIVQAIVKYGIEDPKKFLVDIESGGSVVLDTVAGLISSEVQASPWDKVRSPDFIKKIRTKARTKASPLGVSILDIQWQDFCTARTYRMMGD